MVFPRGEEAKKWFHQPHDIRDIIKFAIDAEKNTVLFFMDILAHDAFVYSKEILEKIIKVEKSYIVTLSKMLNRIEWDVLILVFVL